MGKPTSVLVRRVGGVRHGRANRRARVLAPLLALALLALSGGNAPSSTSLTASASWSDMRPSDEPASGDGDSGDRDSGDRDAGERDSGDVHSGHGGFDDGDTGGRDAGERDSGDGDGDERESNRRDTGGRDSGRDSGDGHSGDGHSGDGHSGDGHSGERDTGDLDPGPADEPAATAPLALVYRNPPLADDENAEHLAAMLRGSPQRFRTRYVGPRYTPLTATLLRSAALFAYPGGDVETGTARRDLAREIPLVRRFVADGGRYLGICAGGFVAGKEGFGVFPGEVDSYVGSPGSEVSDDKDHTIRIRWRGRSRSVDFQDGNYFRIPPGTPGVTVLATYANGLPAVAVAVHGRGKAAYSGPHIEEPIGDRPGSAPLDLDHQLLDALMSPTTHHQPALQHRERPGSGAVEALPPAQPHQP